MESNAVVSKLLELIFGKKPTICDKMVAHSSIPPILMTEDFSKKLALVFKVKKGIVSRRFSNYFDLNYRKMLSSNAKYLLIVILACVLQHESIQNISDSFITMCALVMYLSEETLEKTEVDFRDLNPDIIMVFYQHVSKSSFLGKGRIGPFVKYICGHEYLTWWNNYDLALSDSSVFLEPDIKEKIQKEVQKSHHIQGQPNEERHARLENTAFHMAEKVLKNTSVKFPTLPSESELIKRLDAYRKREKAKEVDVKSGDKAAFTHATSHGNSSSNSDSKIDDFEAQQEDIAWYEDILQAVIRHNHSDNLGQDSANCQIHEEAEGILDHLKNGIKSLIEVLDECENEGVCIL